MIRSRILSPDSDNTFGALFMEKRQLRYCGGNKHWIDNNFRLNSMVYEHALCTSVLRVYLAQEYGVLSIHG